MKDKERSCRRRIFAIVQSDGGTTSWDQGTA